MANREANKIMTGSLFVQNLAAAAGVISIAAMSTTPIACIPTTTASTVRVVRIISSHFTGNPMETAKCSSKEMSVNSLYKKKTATMSNTASEPNMYTSALTNDAALPKI